MTVKGYLNWRDIEESLPASSYTRELIDCPNCGVAYALDAYRMGPVVLMFTERCYRVVCVSCWYSGRTGLKPDKAVYYWNNEVKKSRLLEIREAQGLSQHALGALAGVSYTGIGAWEKGTRIMGADVKQKLADALQVSVSEL